MFCRTKGKFCDASLLPLNQWFARRKCLLQNGGEFQLWSNPSVNQWKMAVGNKTPVPLGAGVLVFIVAYSRDLDAAHR